MISIETLTHVEKTIALVCESLEERIKVVGGIEGVEQLPDILNSIANLVSASHRNHESIPAGSNPTAIPPLGVYEAGSSEVSPEVARERRTVNGKPHVVGALGDSDYGDYEPEMLKRSPQPVT